MLDWGGPGAVLNQVGGEKAWLEREGREASKVWETWN